MTEYQTKLHSVPSGGFLTDRDKDKKPILDVRELGIDFGGLTAVEDVYKRQALNSAMPFLDKATWTVLLITLSGLIGAVTPVGRMAGSTELSNLLLYSVVALLASRASFLELTDAPAWILAGFMILAIHGIVPVSYTHLWNIPRASCSY